MRALDVKYNLFRGWKLPLLTTPIVVMVYLAISYLHPANSQWMKDGSFNWLNFLKFLFIDQMAIEGLTFVILARLTRGYAGLLTINKCSLTLKGWFRYQLLFLPLFLLAFLVFNPVTQSVRYLYHYFPLLEWNTYWQSYFYSTRLYFAYLMPVLLGGYGMLNANLYVNYSRRYMLEEAANLQRGKMEVMDVEGSALIDLKDIVSVEREGRAYTVFTGQGQFRTGKNLNELERTLVAHSFFRVNRAVIINLEFLKNYSFWENDKYIVRLKNGKEFTASRDRIQKLREIFPEVRG